MPSSLDLQIANQIAQVLMRREIANPMKQEDRSQWSSLGNSPTFQFGVQRFHKQWTKNPNDQAYWEKLGAFALVAEKLRCSEFAAATVRALRMNKNFTSNIRVIRAGNATGENHFFVLIDSTPWPVFDKNPGTWGAETTLVDAWAAKQIDAIQAVHVNCGPVILEFCNKFPAFGTLTEICQWDAR